MTYRTFKITPNSIFFQTIGNVKLGFELKHDKCLGENQISISVYIPEDNKKPISKTGVSYAEILANYKSETFSKELIDEIFWALNAELVPHGHQLRPEIKRHISETLKAYIPKKDLPCGAGVD